MMDEVNLQNLNRIFRYLRLNKIKSFVLYVCRLYEMLLYVELLEQFHPDSAWERSSIPAWN